MSFTSQNLKLPYIAPAQAQKHVTVNEALRIIDAVVQLSVLDKDMATPPATPNEGDRYIVAAGGTGVWASQDTKIAAYLDGAWMFITPLTGWIVYIADEQLQYIFDGSVWADYWSSSLAALDTNNVRFGELGLGGATADTTNMLSMNGPAALFNNAGNGIQIKLNKNAVADTASFLFQTGFAGRAEIGLTGNDDFSFKVSPDGSVFYNAIVIDKDNGNVGIAGNPLISRELTVHGNCQIGLDENLTPDNTGKIGQLIIDGAGYAGWIALDANSMYLGHNSGARNLKLQTNETSRITITGIGNVGIGIDAPTTKLDVDGPVRCKSYTVATLPSASGSGAGAMIYVSDETGGAVMAFSDGTDWRRFTDRAVVF